MMIFPMMVKMTEQLPEARSGSMYVSSMSPDALKMMLGIWCFYVYTVTIAEVSR